MKIEDEDETEDYCSDCGCAVDDEICPRCRAKIADAEIACSRRVEGMAHGDRRWNGQAMSRVRTGVEDIDPTILVDIREKP